MKPEIRSFDSADALAAAAAIEVCRLVAEQAPSGAPFGLALPGGRIAKTLFESIANSALKSPNQFGSVHCFWSDERGVPPDHVESNFNLANRCLLPALELPPSQIHRTRGELAPELAAQLLQAELRKWGKQTADGLPILDLIILGMGEDGHIASLFPGPRVSEEGEFALAYAVIGPKPPPNRVTFSFRTLAAARRLMVLIAGDGKAEALQTALVKGANPLGELLRRRAWTEIFCDFPAP